MSKFIFAFLLMMSSHLLEADTTFEIRSSAFFHASGRFREVYGDVGPTLGVELTQDSCRSLQPWLDIDYFSEKMKRGCCCKSRLGVLNTSLGLKYVCQLNCYSDFYLGIGPAIAWLKINNRTCCASQHFSKVVIGGIVKSGLIYHFCESYFLDVFVDYLYQPVHIGRFFNLGGIKIGAGLGTRF